MQLAGVLGGSALHVKFASEAKKEPSDDNAFSFHLAGSFWLGFYVSLKVWPLLGLYFEFPHSSMFAFLIDMV